MSFELDRNFTNQELNEIKNNTLLRDNLGNKTSIGSYVLNKENLSQLKSDLNNCINEYLIDVIKCNDDVKLYITQSWVNTTNKNQYHHIHEHPNSILSGVIYIDANENFDKINFYRPYQRYQQIKINPDIHNLYDNEEWSMPVKSKQIIVFPSYMTHGVDFKQGNNTRISIAFNTFIKGKIGSNLDLTELNI